MATAPNTCNYLIFNPKTLLATHSLAFIFGAYSYHSYIQGDLLHLKHLRENIANERREKLSKSRMVISIVGVTGVAVGLVAMKNRK